MAPEILRGHAYGVAVDWWALGILVGELATGSTPFHAETPRQLMASILNDAPTLPEDEALAVTLEALLEKEPHSRPLADDVRAAPAFASTDWHAVEQLLAPPFPEIDSESFVPEPSPAMEVSRVTTSPESSLEATTALDRRRVQRCASAPLQMPPPPPRTGDTASPRAWASRSPAAVVESESDDEDEAQFYAVEAPTMPRPGADRYGKPRLETLAVAEF
jgi:serine/threonine protein kinase